MWLVDDKSGKQWLSLIDPKGIRNLNLDDPKFGLYKEIKNLEHKLSDDNLSLSAFIVSETCYVDLVNVPDSKRIWKPEMCFLLRILAHCIWRNYSVRWLASK